MCNLQGYLFGEPCPSSGGKAASLCFHPAHPNHRHSPSCLGSFSRSQAPKIDHSEGFAHLTPWKDQIREPCRSPVLHPAKIIHRSLQRKDQSFIVLSETTQPCCSEEKCSLQPGRDAPKIMSSPSSFFSVHLYGRTTIITAIHHFHFCLSLTSSHV